MHTETTRTVPAPDPAAHDSRRTRPAALVRRRAGALAGAAALAALTVGAASLPTETDLAASPDVVPVAHSVPLVGAPATPGDGTVLGEVGSSLQAVADVQPAPPPAPAPAPAGTDAGAKDAARALVAERGWGPEQFSCLESLWEKESSWEVDAANPASSAYGIPQALPGEKMASAGADWATNPATQVRWGVGYVADTYGTPCAAWEHSQANDWY